MPARVSHVVAVPDSLLAPLLKQVPTTAHYIQVSNENQAIAIAAGITIGGGSPLVVMENSGIRAACETVARVCVLNDVKIAVLISPRGNAWDLNWWAANNVRDAKAILDLFGFRTTEVHSLSELHKGIEAALDVVSRRISSVAIAPSVQTLRANP